MSACGRSPGASAECGRRQRQETDSLRRRVRGGGNAAGGAGAGPTGPGGRRGWTPPLPQRRRASVSPQRRAELHLQRGALEAPQAEGGHWYPG